MRPRSSFKLVLGGTLPLALTACSQPDDPITPHPTVMPITRVSHSFNLLVKHNFSTLRDCAESPIPMNICSIAYKKAMSEKAINALSPSTPNASNTQGCPPSNKQEQPSQMSGFQLTVSGTLSWSEHYKILKPLLQLKEIRNEHTVRLENDLILKALLSKGSSTRYFSEPIYEACNARTASNGPTVLRSFASANYTTQSSTHSTSTSSSISRGGFGGQAHARDGWSGRSSSGFSFGG